MADLSREDKEAFFGPNWREVDAQLNAERAQKLDRWKKLLPVVVATIAGVSLLIVAAEAFF